LIPIVLFHRNIFQKWITPKRKLCGLFLEVLIVPLIAFQIYKGDQLCYDFSDYGGIRGGSEKIGKFQPRSFNMGLSRKAFDASKGFEIYILEKIRTYLFDYGI
jgi:hypothetical protein